MLSRGILLYGVAFAAAAIIGFAAYSVNVNYGYLLLPVIAYIVHSAANMLVSYVGCTRTQFVDALKMGSIGAALNIIVLLLVYYVGFLSYPLRVLMPASGPDAHYMATKVFYVAWGAVYAQLISGGILQSC